MGQLLAFTYDFYIETCYKCGIGFGMPRSYQRDRVQKGGSFYCPNGHAQCYVESEVERLEKELALEKERKERALTEANILRQNNKTLERSRAAVSGHLKRTKKRIQNGVCPCCNRTFRNLARHMATKHKDYKDSE